MKKIRTVKVSLRDRSYPIVIGDQILSAKNSLLKATGSKKAVLIADARLEKQRVVTAQALAQSGWRVSEISVVAGETLKDFEKLSTLYNQLLKFGIDRDSTLFALGGGSVGDAAGFIASTYMRGIRWVGLPTTLLAQVDSSIGGKTAVNHPEGKNLIGTFYQPAAVICDMSFLKTLSKRERISGLAEALKYGFIYDPKLLVFMKKKWSALLEGASEDWAHVVYRSAFWKARVVSKDELDRKGLREALNFGHTFAHALETHTGYKIFQHGEAVLWGMRFALALSRFEGRLSLKVEKSFQDFLKTIAVPELPKNFDYSVFRSLISKDKKVSSGQVRFVLLKKLGQAFSEKAVKEKNLERAFKEVTGDSYGR